uniref:Ras-related protein Rab-28 n=1 Tax=Acrobeloides nanus TaxID=290746 RepID=A0A914DDF9_9BILA
MEEEQKEDLQSISKIPEEDAPDAPDNMSDSEEEDQEKTLKIVILGDGTSGKTSICTRFAQRNFSRKYTQTVGVDFFSRRLALPHNIYVLLQIWDIGGQSLSASMLQNYLYGAHGIVFVYDVTNAATFESLNDWVSTVKKITKQLEKPMHMALVGNKTDMEHRRAIRIDKHARFAESGGMTTHYVSAKTGDSINLTFKQIAADILGIQLSKTDMEGDIGVVQAPVAVIDQEEPGQPKSVLLSSNAKKLDDANRSSSVCLIQ